MPVLFVTELSIMTMYVYTCCIDEIQHLNDAIGSMRHGLCCTIGFHKSFDVPSWLHNMDDDDTSSLLQFQARTTSPWDSSTADDKGLFDHTIEWLHRHNEKILCE